VGAMRGRNRAACESLERKIDKAVGRVVPRQSYAGLRENIEAFLVVLAIVGGIRVYVAQPFRIPTGSMQPTLNGITAKATGEAPPNPLFRAFDFVWAGRTYLNLRADQDVTVKALQERTYASFFTFTTIMCDKRNYTVFAPRVQLERDFGVHEPMEVEAVDNRGQKYRKQIIKQYKAGEAIAVGYVDTGDQLFVDRFSYHFVSPKRGDVFVFRTTGIERIQRTLAPNIDSQHYIKRLAGVPGDELRIMQPELFVNNKLAQGEMFRRVMSLENGYRGYANVLYFNDPNWLNPPLLATRRDVFRVPEGSYFALGDNSFDSLDSRGWGVVPERDVAGRALVVYWPFSKRWGYIR